MGRPKGFANKPTKYPWAKWFAILTEVGELYLDKGIDYPETASAQTMDKYFRHRGKNLNLRLGIKVTDDMVYVRIKSTLDQPLSKYPWDKWLTGSPVKLIPGEDFDVPIDSMRKYAKNRSHLGFWSRYDTRRDILWICGEPLYPSSSNIRASHKNSSHE